MGKRRTETCTRHTLAGDGTETTEHSVVAVPRRTRARRPEDPASGIGFLVAADAPVSQLMGREFLCVRDDMSLEAVRALFLERGLSGAPVVNAEGAPVGVVTKTDLVRALGELEPEEAGETLPYGFHMERLPRAIVVEVMTPFVHTLPMRSSVAEAAAFMARHELHHVIVVDPKGTVVGVLTTLDLARWLAAQTGYVTTPPDRH